MAASRRLPLKWRKLIGTLILVPYTILYSLIAMALAVRLLPGQPGLIEVLFFLVGGIVWLPVAMLIIWWMSRP